LFAGPGVVVGLRHDLDHDRHEGVILATELGTLTTVDADFFGAEPGIAQEAGHGVLLDAELGDHPRVDDVVGGKDYAYFLVDGYDHFVVDFHQVGIAAGFGAFDLGTGRGQVGQEFDALGGAVKVFVAPFPLIAGDFNGQVCAGGVLHGDHGARSGQGHADDDQERDDRPGDFNTDVLVEFGRDGAARFAVHDDGVKHCPKHTHENDGTDDEHHPVNPYNVLLYLRYPFVEIELINSGASGHIFDLCTGNARHEQCASAQ